MSALELSEPTFKWSPAEASRRYQAPEAFLCILSLAAATDHGMAVLESEWLQHLTRRWWERGVVAEKHVAALHAAVHVRLSAQQGAALADACAALPIECRLPVFAQALDLMLCNGPLCQTEAEFADALQCSLDLDPIAAQQMRNCMTSKNAY